MGPQATWGPPHTCTGVTQRARTPVAHPRTPRRSRTPRPRSRMTTRDASRPKECRRSESLAAPRPRPHAVDRQIAAVAGVGAGGHQGGLTLRPVAARAGRRGAVEARVVPERARLARLVEERRVICARLASDEAEAAERRWRQPQAGGAPPPRRARRHPRPPPSTGPAGIDFTGERLCPQTNVLPPLGEPARGAERLERAARAASHELEREREAEGCNRH